MIRKLLLGAIGSNAVMIAIAACVGDDPVTSTTPAGDGGADTNTPVDSGVDSGGDASTSDAQSKVAVVDVSGGDGFGCAVRADGTVVCWGRNALGETAQPLAGGATCDGVPCRLPTQVAGITDGAKIASGPHQTCVATKAGKVLCWGANDDGVLGHPTTQDVDCGGGQFCNLTPTEVPNVSGAVGVAVGRTNACAWNATGNVTCWGHNRVGGLARGAPVDQVFAAGPSTAITTNGPTMMSVDSYGTGHYCAIRADGTVACWGRNNAGELGVASDTSPVCNYAPSGAERCEGTPRTVKNAADASIQTATSVASTDGATCVSINTDVYCWGYQGHAIAAAPQAPSSVLPTIRNGATGLSALSGSFTHVCGVTSSREVKCWGENSFAELGVEPSATSDGCPGPTPCKATPVLVAGLQAKKVAAGPGVSFAITLDDKVVAWGANRRGQLGHLPRAGENKCLRPCNPTFEEVVMP